MTTIEIPCAGCGRTLKVGQEHAGKMARCPVCGHITAVPASQSPSPTGLGDALPSAAAPAAAAPSRWYMRTPEGQEYGPTSRADLDRWLAEGRITYDCTLREGDEGPWQSAGAVYPALSPPAPIPVAAPSAPYAPAGSMPAPMAGAYGTAPFADRADGGYSAFGPAAGYAPAAVPGAYAPAAGYQTPHRGALILVLGLMGLFIQCPIFPIIAWVMGSNDLREMEAGRMDRSGRDMTRAGMILGMVLSILWILFALGVFGLIFLAALDG